MFDLLTEKDKELIDSYICRFGLSNGSSLLTNFAPLEKRLALWNAAKNQFLRKVFNDQLILEKEIVYTKPDNDIINEFHEALATPDMKDFIDAVFQNWARQGIIVRKAYTTEANTLQDLFEARTLKDNCIFSIYDITQYTYISSVKLPFLTLDGEIKNVTVQQGAKVMRILNKIAKIIGAEDLFEKFRLKHSMILNKKKYSGTLCLSIHPLDYFTMSDNAEKWSSCMSWRNDGSYRQGTVEMLNSHCAIVAYLKSNNNSLEWEGYKWNSKKWRTLILADENTLVTVKPYPYYSEELLTFCLDWLKEICETNTPLRFPHPVISFGECGDYIAMPEWGENAHMRIFTETCTMYNDFGSTERHFAYIEKNVEPDEGNNCTSLHICYSGPSQCMCCGEATDNFYSECENYVFGECCASRDDGYYCDECGDWVHEDVVYWVEDIPLCEYCFERLAARCALSDEFYFLDNLYTIYLRNGDDILGDIIAADGYVSGRYRLSSCYFTSTAKIKFNEETGCYYITPEDLTDDGLRWLFNINRNQI